VPEIYGGGEAQETNARTGCIGCNLVGEDKMMARILALSQWSYLAPLQRLRPLYAELLEERNRLRQDGTQRLKDGSFPRNAMRMGPLTIKAHRYALTQVKAIQDDVNRRAEQDGRPLISLINAEEEQRILELIGANTWPQGWTGNEPRADLNIPQAMTKDLYVLQNQLLA
jgi:DNA sulfur modification protein DndC